MKIFADENIPLMTVEALRALGHDVLDIRGTVDEGMPDDNIWEKAQREKRMLITTDKGFADCRDQQHCGILEIGDVHKIIKPARIYQHRQTSICSLKRYFSNLFIFSLHFFFL